MVGLFRDLPTGDAGNYRMAPINSSRCNGTGLIPRPSARADPGRRTAHGGGGVLNTRSGSLPTSLVLAAYTALGVVTPASSQIRAGLVTALKGTATVAHGSVPEPIPLARRDAVFLRDRIATRERSFAQLLLGGKALVTVREWSTLTVNDVPRTATVALGIGRLAIAVAKEKMRAGETVQIQTPNCVVAIRGTVVVAEVTRVGSRGAVPGSFATTITVIRGVVEVTLLDPQSGRPVGAPVTVGPLGRVEAKGTTPLHPQAITPEAALTLGSDFSVEQDDWPTVATPATLRDQIDEALRLSGGLAPIQGSASPGSVGTVIPGLGAPPAVAATVSPTISPTLPGSVGASLGTAGTGPPASFSAPSGLLPQTNGLIAPALGAAASPASALPVPIGAGTATPPLSPTTAPILPTTVGPKVPLHR
jgi:FecR-like protein